MIRGIVYDQRGKPLSGCNVRLYTEEILPGGKTVWNLVSGVCTDCSGHYELEIPSGLKNRYHIEVVKKQKRRKNCIYY